MRLVTYSLKYKLTLTSSSAPSNPIYPRSIIPHQIQSFSASSPLHCGSFQGGTVPRICYLFEWTIQKDTRIQFRLKRLIDRCILYDMNEQSRSSHWDLYFRIAHQAFSAQPGSSPYEVLCISVCPEPETGQYRHQIS